MNGKKLFESVRDYRKKYFLKKLLSELMFKGGIYFLLFSLIIIYNNFLVTSPVFNKVIVLIVVIDFLFYLLYFYYKMHKTTELETIVMIENEYEIPDNLLINGYFLKESQSKKIILKLLSNLLDGKTLYPGFLIRNKVIFFFTSFLFLFFSITVFESGRKNFVVNLNSVSREKVQTDISSVSDIKIEVTPPLYTKLSSKIIEGTSGNFSAYIGSKVSITAFSNVIPEKAKLVFDNKREIVPLYVKNHLISGEFVLTFGGRYKFYLYSNGRWLIDNIVPQLVVIKDKSPISKILYPDRNITVKINDTVNVIYEIKDDFGFSKVELKIRGDKYSEIMELEKGEGAFYKGDYDLNISELKNLQEGDVLYVAVLVEDNDNIGGPNTTLSNEIKIEIYSALKEHHKVIKKETKILQLLVDGLNLIINRGFLRGRNKDSVKWRELNREIYSDVSSLYKIVLQDEYSSDELRAYIKKILQRMEKINPDNFSRKYIKSLRGNWEDYIIELDDFLKEQRFDEIKIYQDLINTMKKDLQELVDEYKKTGDEALLDKIKNKSMQIEKKLNEMQKFINEVGINHLPDEFVNSEAYNNLTNKKLRKKIEKLKKSAEKKDKDNVLKNAEDLLSQLKRFDQQINESSKDYMKKLKQPMIEMERFKQSLDYLIKDHKKFINEIKTVQSKQEKKMRKDFVKLDKTVNEIKSYLKHLWNSNNDIKTLNKIRKDRDISSLNNFLNYLEKKYFTDTNKISKWRNDIKKVSSLTGLNKKEMSKLNAVNRRFRGRTEKLKENFEKIIERHPVLRSPVNNDLRMSESFMDKAVEKDEASSMLYNEKQAQQWLNEAKYHLNESKENLQKRMNQMMQSKGQSGSGNNGDKLRKQGKYSKNDEKVKIPGKDKKIGEKQEMIIRSLQEGFPEEYRENNKRYFDDLIR